MDGYKTAGIVTTWLIHGALAIFILGPHLGLFGGSAVACSGSGEARAEDSGKQIMIEAAIAYKKPDAPKQPQKKRSPKRATEKVGVSRDENKKVEPEKDPPKKDTTPSWEDYVRDTEEQPDPDLTEGEVAPKTGGAFDGQEHGWADENKGHPYMQEIARYVRFEIPTLEKGKGEAFACIRLSDDGRVQDTKVRKSGNTNIDRAAEEALRKLTEQRNNDPDVKPVPSELREITTHWICFKPTA